jgi:NADH-quinone oxidoreductase subunit J
MVLAHRERLGPGPDQRELAKRRSSAASMSPACRPPVSTPGTTRSTPRPCCPTARPSELSVSRVLTARDQVTTPQRYTAAEAELAKEIEEDSDAMSLMNYIYLAIILFVIGGPRC